MTLQEQLYALVAPLVEGRMYFDQTPDAGPEGYPYIMASVPSGENGWYVEQKLPDHKHARVQLTAFSTDDVEREKLANRIEKLMCETKQFPAVEPYGSWRGFSIPGQKAKAALQQFGVWYKPDVL